MQRFFSISLLTIALVIGVAGAASTANAKDLNTLKTELDAANEAFQTCQKQYDTPEGQNADPTHKNCEASKAAMNAANSAYFTALDASNNNGTENTPKQDTSTPVKDTKTSVDTSVPVPVTGQNNETTLASQSQDSQYNGIMIKIMTLFAWLVGVAALVLDYAVFYTVVTMGNYISNLTAVGVAWRILRDISNIALIFGFLAIGISIILETNWYGGGTKLLPKLLMAAIFLNFSLFITEAVIDTGNLFATEFYTQINGGVPASKVSLSLTTVSNEGISNKIMSQLGLQTIYGQARDANTEIFKAGNPWLIGFMGILLFIITAFVMFSLAFILIARFVILIFLIILAPIGFIGYAIPQLSKYGEMWSSKLIQQTITAPILLLLLYIALAVITDAQFLTGFGMTGGDSSSATGFVGNANIPGFASFMLSFLVAIGLLLLVVIASKSLSASGAGWATKLGGKLTFGATALVGRSTVGWGSNKAGKYLGRTWVGRVPFAGTGLVKGLDRVAKSSFDVRGTGVLKNLPGGGINAGAAQKGGYQADLKARIKTRTDYAENLITGRQLTPEDKKKQASIEAEMQIERKKLAKADTAEELLAAQARIKELEEKAEDFENKAKTKAAQQRKYANVINLGAKPNSVLNFFNSPANIEAAKIIKEKAKKGKADKDLTAMFKRAVEESASGTGSAGASTAGGGAGGGAAPTGGGGPAPTL